MRQDLHHGWLREGLMPAGRGVHQRGDALSVSCMLGIVPSRPDLMRHCGCRRKCTVSSMGGRSLTFCERSRFWTTTCMQVSGPVCCWDMKGGMDLHWVRSAGTKCVLYPVCKALHFMFGCRLFTVAPCDQKQEGRPNIVSL